MPLRVAGRAAADGVLPARLHGLRHRAADGDAAGGKPAGDRRARRHVHPPDGGRGLRPRRGSGYGIHAGVARSEEHTSELQSLMRISYAVFCLKKKKQRKVPIMYTYKQNTM